MCASVFRVLNIAGLALILLVPIGVMAKARALDPCYPLWNGTEDVAQYAARLHLPSVKSVDLGRGIAIEFVLVPAGQFEMGTLEPIKVDEGAFQSTIFFNLAVLVSSALIFFCSVAYEIYNAYRMRRRIQFSLLVAILLTLSAGGVVVSVGALRRDVQLREHARREYTAAKVRYDLADPSEKPVHSVTLTKPFYVAKFPITQEQYLRVVGVNPSFFPGKDNPVELVSWDEANEFCKKLSNDNQLIALPTEAEWEYSCRAGAKTSFYSGNTNDDLERIAWFTENSAGSTHPVGQKLPNAFGIFDMEGNVWQWCRDWYGEDFYRSSPVENPIATCGVEEHVLRGGSWYDDAEDCRAAARKSYDSLRRCHFHGFRVVLYISHS